MKKTKFALFQSLIALILCCSMLAGTTLAWFTDSVSSANNMIATGTLDVEMEYLVDGQWKTVSEATDLFDREALWEPGHTEVVYLRIANVGNLALKYALGIRIGQETGSVNKAGEDFKLSDYIRCGLILSDTEKTYATRRDAREALTDSTPINQRSVADSGALYPAGNTQGYASETFVTMVVYMPEEVGNEANHAYGENPPRIELGLVLSASQQAYENDSFGSDYDINAELPGFDFPAGSIDDRASAPVDADASGKVSQSVSLLGNRVSAEVPAGVQLTNDTDSLTLTVAETTESEANLTLGENEALRALDVHIEGVDSSNTTPITVVLQGVAPSGLNLGNYKLYHVEQSGTNEMTPVAPDAAFTAHNQFKYDPVTGDITLYIATFSEFTVVADRVNAWNGNVAEAFASDASGSEADPYIIANADQLAYLNALVSAGDEACVGKFYRLVSDVNFGGSENSHIWYPIGYWNPGEGTNAAGENWYTYGGAFQGVFDGAGHTVTGIYQNTWGMDGDYENGYWNEAMGLFGYVCGGTVKNLTIDNFQSQGEFAPTGCVAAYAANAVFENIAVTNSHPQTYNTSVAAVVGRDAENGCNLTFRNITVDSSNTVSALWGSWDVGAGGLLGYLGSDSKVQLENCNVAATMDVYNDVCGNYQYYWYRYCGMLIGTVDKTNADGSLDLSNITATGCTVNFGQRHEYYYCEFEKNSQASYTDDYQFSRVPRSELNLEANPVTCTHSHTAKEDKQAVYLPFYQLFGGYGWGVDGVSLEEYNNLQITVDRKIEVGQEESADKFRPNTAVTALESGRTYTLGTLFSAIDGADIESASVTVGITDRNPENDSTVTLAYQPNNEDWTKSTVIFYGSETIDITIQDYQFCNPAILSGVQIGAEGITVTWQVRLLPNVKTDLPEGALASAPGVQFNNSPYAYTNKTLFSGKHITRIGIPVKSVQALDENQTFTLSVVKTTSDAYKYVSQNVLKLPLDQLGSFTTVNKWVYVDVDLTLAEDETLAFGMQTDTVTWGYSKTNSSPYNFRSASGSWSSVIKESILFDVYATETLEFEQTDEGYAVITEGSVFPNVLTDFPESAIPGGNPVEFTNPPYSYVDQTLFAGKRITRIGIPVKSVLTLEDVPFFTLSVIKTGSGTYQYVSQHKLEIPLEQLNGSATVNKWLYWDVDITLAEDETLAFGGKNDTISWAWKSGFANTSYQFRDATGGQTKGIFFDIRTETCLTYEEYLKQQQEEQERQEAEQEQARQDAALRKVLSGKGISILGDSISTFQGWSNNTSYNSTIGNNAIWYTGSNGVTSVSETWWMQTITRCGLNLVVNNSWSGDEVTNRGVARALELDNNENVNPDIIAVYIGINDFRRGKSEENFRAAYDQMITGMKEKYPKADIYLFTLLYTTNMESSVYKPAEVTKYNAIISEIAAKHELTLVDIYHDTGITPANLATYMHDGRLHPNYAGMDLITQCFMDALMQHYLPETEE